MPDLTGAMALPALASAAASALAGIVTLVVLLAARSASQGAAPLVGGFAAAALLAATLLHLWPESFARSEAQAGVFALAGFGLVYLIAMLTGGSSDNGGTRFLTALAPLFAIGTHSFLDGALHATVFAVDLRTGLTAAPGLVLHEVSETALLYVMMVRAGFGRWAAASLAFVGAVLTTPLGTVLFVGPIASLDKEQLGWALAASAGSLIYLSVAHLSETKGETDRVGRFIAFVAGVALTAALLAGPWAHAGEHDHDRDHDHEAKGHSTDNEGYAVPNDRRLGLP